MARRGDFKFMVLPCHPPSSRRHYSMHHSHLSTISVNMQTALPEA
jgi:hypothetical protein